MTDKSTPLPPNGRPLLTRLGEKAGASLIDNWGLIAKYGIGTAFAIALLLMFKTEYTKDREASRVDTSERTELLKQTNESNRKAIDRMADAVERQANRQDDSGKEAKDFYVKSTAVHRQQVDELKGIRAGQMTASNALVEANNMTAKLLLDATLIGSQERKAFWVPAIKTSESIEKKVDKILEKLPTGAANPEPPKKGP